ncbi:helix-turn-helix domain-containing protein [Kitasatospora sp. NPDC051170]|uniref:helix-turn-helix domain-containing protein n=1 Tax=Kitasatospora sp. NPDC051170 TaxID=3364056 RepID=UPI0037976682
MTAIGELIRELRLGLGWSQRRLAARLEELTGESVTRDEVSRWENGGRTPVKWLPNLATALQVTPNPREAFEADPGLLDRIPRAIFTEDGGLAPVVAELRPSLLLLLESVEVSQEWRGKGVGMRLTVEALRRFAADHVTVTLAHREE